MPSRTRAFGALLLSIVLALGLVAPALAASEATYLGTGRGTGISGTAGGTTFSNVFAGEMRMQLTDGTGTVTGYCIDMHTTIRNNTSGLQEEDWDASGISNLDKVSYILNTYTVDDPGNLLVGTVNQKAAAIQAAIWHFTDGFALTVGHANIVANYNTIIADAQVSAGGSESAPSLTISPADANALVGQDAGPFEVTTTSTSPIPLTVNPADATAVDGDGNPITEVSDGDIFYLRYDQVGDVTASAEVTTTVNAGRVFAKPNVQRLILAETTTASSSDSVTATFSLETVDPEAPDVAIAEECGVPQRATIPDTEGVDYLLDGEPIASGTVLEGPFQGTLTAQAQSGYQLSDPEWSFDLDLSEAEPCPQEVSPVAPVIEISEQCGEPDELTIPDTEGVDYLVDGEPVAAGTVIVGPATGVVTAVAQDGYLLDDPDWSFAFELSEGEPCPLELVPAGTIAAECLEDGAKDVTVTLDNSDSEDEVTFVVEIAGETIEVDVAAGDTATVERQIDQGTGEFDVSIAADGEVLASETLDTTDCEVEVAGVVLERDEDETEVLGVSQTLPETGAPTTALLMLGLLGLGLGAAMVTGRRRTS